MIVEALRAELAQAKEQAQASNAAALKAAEEFGAEQAVGVLGTGVPKLACLWPMAWLSQQAVWSTFINKASKTLARVQASRGGRRKTSSEVA